ncbi:unnamed protein product [Prorocentrum cordatum]|uniref:Autophagy-related protein 9 n=2 Tax=Prorocentrum cordatum TaxID=2364126 RepID=A0ABN9PZZ9_9DINO|nr:unnamed protein product [Polarella glacialis]
MAAATLVHPRAGLLPNAAPPAANNVVVISNAAGARDPGRATSGLAGGSSAADARPALSAAEFEALEAMSTFPTQEAVPPAQAHGAAVGATSPGLNVQDISRLVANEIQTHTATITAQVQTVVTNTMVAVQGTIVSQLQQHFEPTAPKQIRREQQSKRLAAICAEKVPNLTWSAIRPRGLVQADGQPVVEVGVRGATEPSRLLWNQVVVAQLNIDREAIDSAFLRAYAGYDTSTWTSFISYPLGRFLRLPPNVWLTAESSDSTFADMVKKFVFSTFTIMIFPLIIVSVFVGIGMLARDGLLLTSVGIPDFVFRSRHYPEVLHEYMSCVNWDAMGSYDRWALTKDLMVLSGAPAILSQPVPQFSPLLLFCLKPWMLQLWWTVLPNPWMEMVQLLVKAPGWLEILLTWLLLCLIIGLVCFKPNLFLLTNSPLISLCTSLAMNVLSGAPAILSQPVPQFSPLLLFCLKPWMLQLWWTVLPNPWMEMVQLLVKAPGWLEILLTWLLLCLIIGLVCFKPNLFLLTNSPLISLCTSLAMNVLCFLSRRRLTCGHEDAAERMPCFLSYDVQAAFPSMNWQWIAAVLLHHCLPAGYICAIWALYHDLQVSAWFGDEFRYLFQVSAGVAQGRPLSGTLWALCFDAFLFHIAEGIDASEPPCDHLDAGACADDVGVVLPCLSQAARGTICAVITMSVDATVSDGLAGTRGVSLSVKSAMTDFGVLSPRALRRSTGAEASSRGSQQEAEPWEEKLDRSERDICAALQPSVPAVTLVLPRPDPASFAAQLAQPGYRPLVQGLPPRDEPRLPAVAAAPSARAAWPGGPRAAASLGHQLAWPLIAAAASACLAVGVGHLRLGLLAGPALAASASACLCTLGLARTWRDRADANFGMLSRSICKARDAAARSVDAVEGLLLRPVQRLQGLVDVMVEEQQPAFARMQEHEAALKEQGSDPTWRAPNPASLKRPLCGPRGCLVSLRRELREVRHELLEYFDQSMSSQLSGRIATEHAAFERYVVHLPVFAALTLNMTLSVVQVVLAAGLAAPGTSEVASAPVGPRPANIAAVLAPATRRLLNSGATDSGPGEEILQCLRPAVVQAALCLAQVAAAFALSRGPPACAVAIAKISSLEVELNTRVNRFQEQVLEFELGPAFADVKAEAALFFPQFRECMRRLRVDAQRKRRADKLHDLEKQAMRLGF